jgi:hypothetical protein
VEGLSGCDDVAPQTGAHKPATTFSVQGRVAAFFCVNSFPEKFKRGSNVNENATAIIT